MNLVHGRSTRRSHGWHATVAAAAIALLVAACGQAPASSEVPPSSGGPASPAATAAPPPDQVGIATVSRPDQALVLATSAYGRVPVNQVIVVLADGKARSDADALATALGGRVVGQIDFLNAFQVETSGTTEADLAAALKTARASEGVVVAAPNQGVDPAEDAGEIWGTRISPMTDPIYGGGNGDGYGLIGVPTAWDYLRGSGMDLDLVQVGVVDSGLWAGSNEFDEGAHITFTEPDAQLGSPEKQTNADGTKSDDPSGGHGSGVSVLIGADADDGGPAGVASVLGDKLTISSTNLWSGDFGTQWTAAEPDPDDPTIVTYPGDGGTYQYSSLVAIMRQVNAGSTIINMSWGPKDPAATDPNVPKVYRAFFERMARERPDVIFVAAAGNHGVAGDGSQMYPGGFNLPNVMTVGNVTNDGSVWKSSNTSGNDFEVSIFAPGHQAVRGQNPDTQEIKNLYGGTSMAAPQVAATAALLRSLNKGLTAEQIKQIITSTATDKDGTMVLAVDEAVKAVIDLNCDQAGIPRIDKETLLGRAVVDAVAVPVEGAPGTYLVRGVVTSTGVKGVELDITVADGDVTSGEEPAFLEAAGESTWTVTLDPPDEGVITVRRLDNKAGSSIAIETIDVNGAWAGTFTITSVTLDPAFEEQAEEQGCDVALLQALEGTALPMTLDLTVNPDSSGTSTFWIDVSSLKGSDGESLESEPQDAPVTYRGSLLTFKPESSGGAATSMSGTVSRRGSSATINGTVTIAGEGYSAKAVWTVTKNVE